ncbi:nitroreductase [Pollutimonas nitritireducens]|nr:nitroreductase [Pollutimonas nitritireducens]
MTARHSCRAFLPQLVTRDVIMQILLTSQQTASWCNAQPWRVYVVSGDPLEALRADLIRCAEEGRRPNPELDWPREYRDVFQARRRECGWLLYGAVGIEKGDRAGSAEQARENFRLFGAPHLAVVTSPDVLGTHGCIDTGGWVSNFMLTSVAHGVGTIAQAALASWPDVLRKHLPIEADQRIVCGISFGYADNIHPANGFRTTRAPLGEVVTWVD